MPSHNCVIFVNNEKKEIVPGEVSHCVTLYEYLRSTLGLKSVKYVSDGCGGGGNLSSVVMVTMLSPTTGVIESHRALDSLCTPLIALHGCAITTLEALGDRTQLHPIQARVLSSGACPCGYCAPGIIMLLYTMLMNTPQPTVRDVDRCLAGVWCRCSGFRALLDVARSFAVDVDDALRVKMTASSSGEPPDCVSPESTENYPPLSDDAESREILSTAMRIAALRRQFPLYPHEHLKPPTLSAVPPLFLYYGKQETAFLLPASVDEVIRCCKVVPDYTTVNSADDFYQMVLRSIPSAEGPPMSILSTSRVKELLEVNLQTDAGSGQSFIFIGAAATYANIIQRLPKLISHDMTSKDPWTVAALVELRAAIEDQSVTQVEENSFTLVSHMMARPCGELVPFLHCLGAKLIVLTSKGREEFSVVDVTGASRSIAKLDVVLGLKIPQQKSRFVGFSKANLGTSRGPASASVAIACDITRRELDIVASNFCVATAGSSFYMTVLPDVATALDRVNLSCDTIRQVRIAQDKLLVSLRNLVHGPSDGRVSYRITLTRSLIFRLMNRLQASVGITPMDSSTTKSEAHTSQNLVSFGVQSWESCYGHIYSSTGQPATDTEEVELRPTPVHSVVSPTSQHAAAGPPPPPLAATPSTASGKAPVPSKGAAAKRQSMSNSLGVDGANLPSKSPRQQQQQQQQQQHGSATDTNSMADGAKGIGSLPTPFQLPAPTSRSVVKRSPVGDSMPSISQLSHTLGQTQFASDLPIPEGCLYAAFVRSTIPKGTIKDVNAAAARAMPGVVAYYDVRDLPLRPLPVSSASAAAASSTTNHSAGLASGAAAGGGAPAISFDPTRGMVPPEAVTDNLIEFASKALFVERDVDFIGQIVGIVIGTSPGVARRGARSVAVDYVKDHRVAYCLSLAEAREVKAFFPTVDAEVLSTAAAPTGSAGGRGAMPLRKLFESKDLQSITGSFSVGGQFLLSAEPTTILCLPVADDSIEIVCTSEAPSLVRRLVSAKLLIPAASVTVRTSKLGGLRPDNGRVAGMATAVALATQKLRKPVLFVSSLEEDTHTSGLSHSAMVDYRVAVDPVTSLIQGVDVQVYLNCGATKGESEEVLRNVLRHVCNAYRVPLLRARGVLCRTNYPPSNPHPGSSAALGVLIMENLMDSVARNLKVSRWKLQYDHLMQPNEVLPYGQVGRNLRLGTMWQDLLISAAVSDRMTDAHEFNRTSRYRKRGIAMVPVLVGIRLPNDDDHHSTALVTLLSDGTLRVKVSVVECGIGMETKVTQAVARCFKIPLCHVRIAPFLSTDDLDLTAKSATCMAVELACVAALNASEALLSRLDLVRPMCGANPTLGSLARAAISAGISITAVGRAAATTTTGHSAWPQQHSANSSSLSSAGPSSPQRAHSQNPLGAPLRRHASQTGNGSEPLVSFIAPDDASTAPTAEDTSPRNPASDDRLQTAAQQFVGLTPCGHLCKPPTPTEPFGHFVQGVSCAEVELDVLTGAHRVLRVDILVDGGTLINPLIDATLVERQFCKGASWVTTEEVICGDKAHPEVPEGTYFNGTLSNYFPWRLQDVPKDFRVAFFGGSTTANQAGGVHGSRSILEPSFALGCAVMFALREAVYSARDHTNDVRPAFLELHCPLTAERVRMACTDEFSQGTFAGAECQVVGSY